MKVNSTIETLKNAAFPLSQDDIDMLQSDSSSSASLPSDTRQTKKHAKIPLPQLEIFGSKTKQQKTIADMELELQNIKQKFLQDLDAMSSKLQEQVKVNSKLQRCH